MSISMPLLHAHNALSFPQNPEGKLVREGVEPLRIHTRPTAPRRINPLDAHRRPSSHGSRVSTTSIHAATAARTMADRQTHSGHPG